MRTRHAHVVMGIAMLIAVVVGAVAGLYELLWRMVG